jgi:hypothetical protein
MGLVMAENKKRPSNSPLKFGEKEKPNYVKTSLLWGIVVLGIVAIIWMAESAPRQKPLVCRTGFMTSLTGFGTCTEE